MENRINPLNKKGERDFYCRNYKNCLDVAVEKKWENMSCEECKFYRKYKKFEIGYESGKSSFSVHRLNLFNVFE